MHKLTSSNSRSSRPARGAVSRRDFLKGTAATSGLVIGFHLVTGPKLAHAQQPAPPASPPNAFLRIGKDGSITVQVKHLEFGQGVMTALPMLVAEELECDWTKVRSELAPAAPVYTHLGFGMQMTGGSSSVVNSWTQLRTVGAMARAMLIQAAAAQWKVDAAKCKTQNGMVVGPKAQKAAYGALADAAMALPMFANTRDTSSRRRASMAAHAVFSAGVPFGPAFGGRSSSLGSAPKTASYSRR